MSLPVRHLPVIQNWDCHVCGECCKEYLVTITEEERQRIEAQGWTGDPGLNGRAPLTKSGFWWNRTYHLGHQKDGSCVFLSPEGRCRIHERFGYEAKPLACKLFPFVLVPAGDHWRVGVRFACPSASANKGRAVVEHGDQIRRFAAELAKRSGLETADGISKLTRPLALPRMQGRQRVEWPDLLRFVQTLGTIIRKSEEPIEYRLRKCLGLADLCRQARLNKITGNRLEDFLGLMVTTVDAEVPADPVAVPRPNWVGRVLFRQAAALFARKDHGPNRGEARKGRLALLRAAWRFARGAGPVPRLHAKFPPTTFEEIETRTHRLDAEAEQVLERYYRIKIDSLQFFGATNFRLPFWEGLEMLALTFPIVCWIARAFSVDTPSQAVQKALVIVDDHFGYNPVLRSSRQQFSFRLLARTGELKKLIAWYGR